MVQVVAYANALKQIAALMNMTSWASGRRARAHQELSERMCAIDHMALHVGMAVT
jgi:hypothetical protein